MHRRWASRLVLAVCSLAIVAGASWTFGEWRFESGLARAKVDMTARRFPEARRWLAAQAVSRPEDVEIAYLLGICEQALGHAEAAVAALGRVPPACRFGGDAALARGHILMHDLGRYTEAEDVLRAALPSEGRRPSAARFRYALSQLLFWEGRLDEMRRLSQEGWENSPDRAGDLHDLWRIDNAPPTFEPIQAAVERAGRAAPDDDRVWLARANLAVHAGRLDEAERWLDACLGRRPDDPAVWRARLRWAQAADRLEEAQRDLSRLAADRFTEGEALALRAWLAARRGQADAERAALEGLIDRVPGDTQALERLAVLAVGSGQPTRAAELRRRKAGADELKSRYYRTLERPEPTAHAIELAELAESLGRGFDARAWWALAAQYRPGDPTAAAAVARLGPPRPDRYPGPEGARLTLAQAVDPDAGGIPEHRAGRGPDRPVGDARTSATRPASGRPRPPAFRDDAAAAGLLFTLDNGRSRRRQIPETTAGGLGLLDYDGDGWLDIYLLQGGPFPPAGPTIPNGDRLFRNMGDGRFQDVSRRSGIGGFPGGYGLGVAVGDVDNDGDPDLFITRWRSYALYRNRGDGTFEDFTRAAGLDGDRDWPTSAAFADLDGDGDLDLYVCHYLDWDAEHPMLCPRRGQPDETTDPDRQFDYCMPNPLPARPDHLFRNDGGRFVDVTARAGIVDRDGRGLGVVAADIDDDGRVDLFVANDTTANYLWHNNGDMKFEEIGISSGVACSAKGAFQAGMGTAVGDLDGDGRPDLFVTNFYGESTSFYNNLGGGLFADRTGAVGLAGPTRFLLGFGIVTLDANNDGRLDLAQANGHVIDMRPTAPVEMPGLLLIGGDDGRLVDATATAGPAWTAGRIGRGLAAGDLDNDGRVDVLLLPQKSPLAYLHNQTAGGHFVTFQLEGTRSNRDAVGAVVAVTAGGRRRRAWRYGGGSYQSASDPRVHFGLEVDRIEDAEIRWPSGGVDHFRNLESDRGYRLREGDLTPVLLKGYGPRRAPMEAPPPGREASDPKGTRR